MSAKFYPKMNILELSVREKNTRVLSMKKTLPFKTIKKNCLPREKKNALVDTRPNLYLNSEIPLRTTRGSSRTTLWEPLY